MIRKNDIFDKITHALSTFSCEIQVKANLNLLDDNVFSEDIIKELLNECMGWDLQNLNKHSKNYPGIDLGDKEKKIGVQVTSNKSGKKIRESLDTVKKNDVDKTFYKIYFFILGKKQNSYTVNFDDFPSLDVSEDNIWDFSDVIKWCKYYDTEKLIRIWEILQRELVINECADVISSSIKNELLNLIQLLENIFKASKKICVYQSWHVWYDDDVKKSLSTIKELLPYIDVKTYNACKAIIDQWIELKKLCSSSRKGYIFSMYCEQLLEYELVLRNLNETYALLNKNISGCQEGINVVIDGDNLFERLMHLGINTTIIENQFSIKQFLNCIENTIFRKSKYCVVFLTKDSCARHQEFIKRMNMEGTIVIEIAEKHELSRYIIDKHKHEKLIDSHEIALISDSEILLNDISSVYRGKYIYTISIEQDVMANHIPFFFVVGNIFRRRLNSCFIYDEGKKANIKSITSERLRDLISNANDDLRHQLRVDWSGDVYISTTTGSEDIEDVKFRWESWDSGNGYAGPFAASNHAYIEQMLQDLKLCWEKNLRGYVDYW